jgi:hypothetical protein
LSIEKIELFAIPVYKIKCTYHDDIKLYMNKHAVSKYNTSLKQMGTQDIFTDYLTRIRRYATLAVYFRKV